MLGYPNSTTALVVLGPSLRKRKLTGATIRVCLFLYWETNTLRNTRKCRW